MNNYDYMFNHYGDRAFSMNDFNVLTQYDLNPNMASSMNNQSMTNNPMNLYTPKEAFDKGNLFANIYQPYKNWQPIPLQANTEQERKYLDFARMTFAAHELNLYLDNYPNDTSMLQLFNDYRKKADTLKQEYESAYGPISISANISNNVPFTWENQKWPWEGGK